MNLPKKRKPLEYPKIEIKNKEIVKLIYQSDKSLNTIAKESNMTIKEVQSLIDEHHNSLDLKMEQDKQKRKDIKAFFLNFKKGLKELRDSMPNLPPGPPPKNYCKINIGGKWVNPEVKRLGPHSFVYELNKEDMEEI